MKQIPSNSYILRRGERENNYVIWVKISRDNEVMCLEDQRFL